MNDDLQAAMEMEQIRNAAIAFRYSKVPNSMKIIVFIILLYICMAIDLTTKFNAAVAWLKGKIWKR